MIAFELGWEKNQKMFIYSMIRFQKFLMTEGARHITDFWHDPVCSGIPCGE